MSFAKSTLILALFVCGALAYTVDNHNKIVGCYYSSFAYYRPGNGQFDVSNIDPSLCTVVYYAFSGVDNATSTVRVMDPYLDLMPTDPDCLMMFPDDPEMNCKLGGFRNFVALKEKRPATNFMLSVGGWATGSKVFSDLAADAMKRAAFVTDAVRICLEYGFDGIDLDWEYPGQYGGAPEDFDNFVLLVQEMQMSLHQNGLLFSAALPAGYDKIDAGINVPEVSKHLDWMNILSYDYAGSWNMFTSHNSPLYARPEDADANSDLYMYNVYDTLMYYESMNIDMNKVVLGLPMYGRGWTMEQGYENNPGLYCPAVGGNPAGPYTSTDGIYGFAEVMEAQSNNTLWNMPDAMPGQWSVHQDNCYAAPHMVNGPYWISYDNVGSIAKKIQFANFKNLAGAMVYSMDMDDFSGASGIKYPLLQAVNDAFYTGSTFNPAEMPCTPMQSCM